MLLRIRTGGGDTETLEDEIPVMAVLNSRKAQNGSLKDYYDKEDSDSQLEVTNRTFCYVPAVLPLTKVDNEHPPTLQQTLEAQHRDPECRKTLEIVKKHGVISMRTQKAFSYAASIRLGNPDLNIRRSPHCNPLLMPLHDM